jgi:hypothetical protein
LHSRQKAILDRLDKVYYEGDYFGEKVAIWKKQLFENSNFLEYTATPFYDLDGKKQLF